MKCIKKLVALTLAAVLALTMLTACGGTSDTKSVADKVADIINAERVAANHTELPRATEVDKLWSPLAELLAAYAANPTEENAAALQAKGDATYAEYINMTIDGKQIDTEASKRKALRNVVNFDALANSMKGDQNGWEWLIEGDYDYISVVSAEKDGHNGVYINAIKLKD